MNQTAKLIASDGMEGDELGSSISISGHAVAAPGQNGPGAAYVFVEPASGWANMNETAELTASDGQKGDAFGCSVAIGGHIVMVGAGTQASMEANTKARHMCTLSRGPVGPRPRITMPS